MEFRNRPSKPRWRLPAPYEQLRTVRSAARSPGRAARTAAATARGLWAMTGVVAPPPPSSLNGPIGPHRRWAWARSQLSDVKRIRGALGGTVNDVVLTAIAGGFRALLAGREESTQRDVRTLVPLSVRSNEEHGEYNNRVSAIFNNRVSAIFATLRTAAPTVLKSLDDGARSPPG